jgi:hypothetical protein
LQIFSETIVLHSRCCNLGGMETHYRTDYCNKEISFTRNEIQLIIKTSHEFARLSEINTIEKFFLEIQFKRLHNF